MVRFCHILSRESLAKKAQKARPCELREVPEQAQGQPKGSIGFRVQRSGFRGKRLRLQVEDFGLRDTGLGLRDLSLRINLFSVKGEGFRVHGLGFSAKGLGYTVILPQELEKKMENEHGK